MGTIQRKIGASVERKTAAFTAVAGGFYLCNTTGGTFTATLPSGTAQDIITFSDDARTWGTINLTIAPASGETIDGLAANETLICDLTGAFVTLTWNGTTWTIATNGFASSVSNGSLSSGSGSGSKNYILNTNSSVNWAASDAGITVSDETVAANLPDNSTQTTAIKVLRASGTTSYARYRFVLDQADYGKKFQLSFDMKYAGAAGDYKLEIYSFATNAYTSGTLISPVTTDIPALSAGGTFTTSVDMPGSAAPYIEFRVRGNGVSTPLYLNSVYAGPGIITQGAAVSDPVAVTFTGTWTTNTTYTAFETRIGSWAKYEVKVAVSGAPTATGLTLTLPSGRTINTAALANSAGQLASILPNSSAGIFDSSVPESYPGYVSYATTTTINVLWSDDTAVATKLFAVSQTAPMTFATGDFVTVSFMVPISEWAGNGTVNLGAGAQVEWSSDDGSADVFGPNGSLVPNVAASTGSTTRAFAFQYPQQTTQAPTVEYYNGNGWANAADLYPFSAGNNSSASNFYGIRGYWSSSTLYTVEFGNQGTRVDASNVSAGTTSWATRFSAGDRFRVSKVNPSSPVGFGLAGTDGSSGLYKAGSAPGSVAGTSISTGYLGEMAISGTTQRSGTNGFSYSVQSTTVPTTATAVVTITLNKGVYLVSGTCSVSTAGAGLVSGELRVGGTTVTKSDGYFGSVNTVGGGFSLSVPVTISADSTAVAIYATMSGVSASAARNEIFAVRIA